MHLGAVAGRSFAVIFLRLEGKCEAMLLPGI